MRERGREVEVGRKLTAVCNLMCHLFGFPQSDWFSLNGELLIRSLLKFWVRELIHLPSLIALSFTFLAFFFFL